MSVTVKIPTQLRDLVGGRSQIDMSGVGSVRELIQALSSDHPQLVERIVDESGALRRFVNLYVGDEDVRFLDGLDTSLEDPQVVSILPAVAGGTHRPGA